MARKAKPKIITVDGACFLVRRTWGQRKDFLRQRDDIFEAEKKRNPEYDPGEEGVPSSREYDEAMLQWTDNVVTTCVEQWQDEEGAWHDWAEDDELDGDEAQKLVATCLGDVQPGVDIEGVVPLGMSSE